MARPRKKETFRGNADGFGKVESIQEEKAEPEQPAPEPKEAEPNMTFRVILERHIINEFDVKAFSESDAKERILTNWENLKFRSENVKKHEVVGTKYLEE